MTYWRVVYEMPDEPEPIHAVVVTFRELGPVLDDLAASGRRVIEARVTRGREWETER